MNIPELFLQEIEEVRSGQRNETILIWRGMPLLISRATAKDVERINAISRHFPTVHLRRE